MSLSNTVKELENYYTTEKSQSRTGKASQTPSVEFLLESVWMYADV